MAGARSSPIRHDIESMNDLRRIGIETTIESSDDEETPSYTFKIRCKPSQQQPAEPLRLDLILKDKDAQELRLSSPTHRFRTRFSSDQEGIIEANFSIRRVELPHAFLVLWKDQHAVHFLSIKHLIDGFPPSTTEDPFGQEQTPEAPE